MYDMQPYLKTIDEVIARGPFKDTWESLSEFQVPNWYQKAKFGIFLHWGVYSAVAYESEWYPRNMYIQDHPSFIHHVQTWGPHKKFGYKDFIPLFKAEKFDPEKWTQLFENAGAKYVVPVAEHHDGFQMYKSDISHWNAYEMGPQRDVLGELKKHCEAHDMTVGAASHRIEHWFFMGHGKDFDSDIKEPLKRGDFYWPAMAEGNHGDIHSEPTPTEEFLQDWLVRTCEIIDQYRPKLLYFDWWIQHMAAKSYLRKLTAYYYNRAAEWGIDVAINYKTDAYPFGCAVPDLERGKFATVKPFFWQTDTAVALNSWCYTENNSYRTSEDLLCDLVDIVSKNGCLLLNVGPKPDGTITLEEEQILLEMGEWLKVNGEAIYETSPWKVVEEGPTKTIEGQFHDWDQSKYTSEDVRFVRRGGYLYAIVLKKSVDGEYRIKTLATTGKDQSKFYGSDIYNVEVLGGEKNPLWSRDEEGLKVPNSAIVQKEMPL